ncbi:hypothetical protein R6Q59_015033 [Mikania micrantha]
MASRWCFAVVIPAVLLAAVIPAVLHGCATGGASPLDESGRWGRVGAWLKAVESEEALKKWAAYGGRGVLKAVECDEASRKWVVCGQV